jgi:hypothetical protein
MKKLLLAATLLLASITANSEMVFIDYRLVGYTIHSIKTVTGYRDEDGKKGKEFTGCKRDRIIIFDDNTALKCDMYDYTGYSYRPNAIIFISGRTVKMQVDGNLYDMKL